MRESFLGPKMRVEPGQVNGKRYDLLQLFPASIAIVFLKYNKQRFTHYVLKQRKWFYLCPCLSEACFLGSNSGKKPYNSKLNQNQICFKFFF